MQNTPWVDLSIERGPVYGEMKRKVGLRMFIHAHPYIEQFMQNLANGKVLPVEALGSEWIRIPEGSPLEAYAVNFGENAPAGYVLSSVHGSLLIDPGKVNEDEDGPQPARLAIRPRAQNVNQRVANLSFLTLVGISAEEGLQVGFPGVYSVEYLQAARNIVLPAVKQFLHDFVVPITINLQIVQKL